MMTFWRQATALMLPLWILGCGATQTGDAIANAPTELPTESPAEPPVVVSAPVEVSSPQASATTSASPAEPAYAQPEPQLLSSLNAVPPSGLDSLSESDLRYFQTMGPLEYAARLGGVPAVPAWRARLQLYPVWQDAELLYQVKVDHYNLSPTVYTELVRSYGADNADPALNNSAPHQHIELEFFPVMNMAADWLSESTQTNTSDVTSQPMCGLGSGCTAPDDPDGSQWNDDLAIDLDAAPWQSPSDPLPLLVRTLANQAGWLQDGQWTLPSETPEGISDERPWVEILVTNAAGNGGGYTAHWIERIADDSVRAVVYRLYADVYSNVEGPSSLVSTGYICGRGAVAGQIRALCP